MTFLLCFAILAGFTFTRLTREERARVLRLAIIYLKQATRPITDWGRDAGRFREALVARTPRVVATPVLAALTAGTFAFMLFAPGDLSAPETLIKWGANYGPRTTNGEWWRLASSMFVHGGVIPLAANLLALVQLGPIVERMVGPYAFLGVYVTAGVCASVVSLALNPLAAGAGASGAVVGLYGLLMASSVWSVVHRSVFTIPFSTLKRALAIAALFILGNIIGGGIPPTAVLMGLVAGFFCGLAVSRTIAVTRPPLRVAAATAAVAIVVAGAAAIALRGLNDVRPEVMRLIAAEDRASDGFRSQLDLYNQGSVSGAALAQMIRQTILPELRAAHSRLSGIGRVPQTQDGLVADANGYVLLRETSWRLRALGLETRSLPTLLRADEAERTSTNILRRIAADDLPRRRYE